MHMESAIVTTGVAVASYAVSMGSNAFSFSKARKTNYELSLDNKEQSKITKKPLFLGIMTGLVFALQMLNVTVSGHSSGHFVGAILLAYLFGPYMATMAMTALLSVQCLVFADGGLLALGCNIFNMGVLPCLIIYPILTKLFSSISNKNIRTALTLSIGSYLTVVIGSFMVCLETIGSGINFVQFAKSMLAIHLVIGLIEVFFTLVIVSTLKAIQSTETKSKDTVSYISMGLLMVAFATILSSFASALPDGLEYSLENMNIATSAIDTFMSKSFFAGYNLTALSGIMGAVILTATMFGASKLIKQNTRI